MLKLKDKLAKLRHLKISFNIKKGKQVAIPPPPPKPIPRGFKVVEKYPLYEPFAHVAIVQNPKTGEYKYILDELQLDPLEKSVYDRILEILLAEIESPKEEITDPRKFFAEEAKKIVDKYRISLGWLPDVSWYKILYHAERDLVGFGRIDPLMRDPNIEDISCDGVGPIFIAHKVFGSLESTITFRSHEELNEFVIQLSERIGRPVSFRTPIVDASLPDGSRLNIVFGNDISRKGTNFTIRKFNEVPLSITQLINFGTLNAKMAAYLWMLLYEGSSIFCETTTATSRRRRN